jgi:hypothetical protein
VHTSPQSPCVRAQHASQHGTGSHNHSGVSSPTSVASHGGGGPHALLGLLHEQSLAAPHAGGGTAFGALHGPRGGPSSSGGGGAGAGGQAGHPSGIPPGAPVPLLQRRGSADAPHGAHHQGGHQHGGHGMGGSGGANLPASPGAEHGGAGGRASTVHFSNMVRRVIVAKDQV